MPEQDQVTLLLGIAAAQAVLLELAEPALARAVANPATRDQAEPWLVALGSEKGVATPVVGSTVMRSIEPAPTEAPSTAKR